MSNKSITQNIYDALDIYAQTYGMSYLGRAMITPDKYTEIAGRGATVRVANMEGGTLQMGGDRQSVKRTDVLQFIEIYNIPSAQNERDRPTAEREVDLIADDIALALWNSEFLQSECINVTEILQRNTYTKPGSVKTPTAELRITINPKGQARG
jgi:hypothetical protein